MKTILTAALYLLTTSCSAIPIQWNLSWDGIVGINVTSANESSAICHLYASDRRPSNSRDGFPLNYITLESVSPGIFRAPYGSNHVYYYVWPVCPYTNNVVLIVGNIRGDAHWGWWPNSLVGPSLTPYESREVKIPTTGRDGDKTPLSTESLNYAIEVTSQSTDNVSTSGWVVDPDLTIRGYIQGLVAGEYTVTLTVRFTPL